MPSFQTGTSGRVHRSPVKNFFRLIGWTLTVLILLAVTGWETLVVYYSNLPEPLRLPGAIGVALISLLSVGAYADSATTDVNSMVDQLAPKADAAPPSSAVLTVKTATELNVVERLQLSPSRAVGAAATRGPGR